jgi:hypothetical protein
VCARTGCGRGIRTIEVRKIAFGITVDALLDLSVLFKTEVVIAESFALSDSRGAEDYAGALATSKLHSILLCSSSVCYAANKQSDSDEAPRLAALGSQYELLNVGRGNCAKEDNMAVLERPTGEHSPAAHGNLGVGVKKAMAKASSRSLLAAA